MRIYKRRPGSTVGFRRATDEDILQAEIAHPDDPHLPALSAFESLVCFVNGPNGQTTVGFLEYVVDGPAVTVTNLWVAPDRRRNGYGSIMLELLLKAERPTEVLVSCPSGAEGFFAKCGFTRAPERVHMRYNPPAGVEP